MSCLGCWGKICTGLRKRSVKLARIEYFVKDLKDNFALFANGFYPTSLFLANLMVYLPFLKKIKFYPKKIHLPGGLKLYVNDAATLTVNVPDQYIRREYELHSECIPRPGWTIFDVGAYVGLYSLRASKLAGGDGMVLAFEPNPIAYCWLSENIRLNKASNIIPFPYALGSENGIIEFYAVTKGNLGMSSPSKEHVSGKFAEVERYAKCYVPAITLDHFVQKIGSYSRKALNTISLMKIDVEGHEPFVLSGATKTLERGLVQRIIVEIHLDSVKSNSIVDFLDAFGYNVNKVVRFDHVKEVAYFTQRK